MQRFILVSFLLLLFSNINAQQSSIESTQSQHIQEVIVIGTTKISSKENKSLGSIDEYLQKSAKVDMIKRGAYAWEPLINGLPTERTLVTIDGMRIFGACTDKMDPITSYIEVSNLSEATISSGQEGSCHGNTIGGAIDLKRNKMMFGQKKWNFNVNSGFETVNNQKIFGAGTNFKTEKFYTDVNFMMRDADNYKAGNNTEILFSQFRKMNISGISGVKLGENKLIEAAVIYDKANNVGYPALPMDVSIAEALITSLKFQMLPQSDFVKSWETKVYFNNIMHRMDDTKRPNVPIHMDMPGWSKTFGYYSQLKSVYNQHHFLLNINGFYNKSRAEMTMYPEDPNEKLMFMLTWPDVRTLAQAIYLEDQINFNQNSSLKLSASVTMHQNKVESEFGLNSLQIFYSEMKAEKSRILKSFAANYEFNKNIFQAGFGLGYGDRAPSVSEGYGFYLFNSFEKYDYIGNPYLKNESSLEANAFVGMKKDKFNAKISSSYFHISDYIVGKIIDKLVPMTIGANGVKSYTALDYATVFNISLSTEVKLAEPLKWNTQFVYTRGKDNQGKNLPFMSPFSYQASLKFEKNKFSSDLSVLGNTKHQDFAAIYGESATPDYFIMNASLGYLFNVNSSKILAKVGVENLFDRFYTTYSDWNKIPRPGRNFYLNLNFNW
ncbi:TonB-dependent receptor plug domain-containing protein [Kaistella jeonii]|uniref:TonB-dependent receptor n=1 Tax=Kaistella jeonii TaxID=266749 RepID=A0A0C1FMY5_9FLAO|nr:TonB-dependent receptor plug domain-containing protein [Kaistella jeonii]KIA89304.1 TonB-dependent receptor [Kaistella jeonii]SFC02335.1 iron complex outermembrane recepter protein [Kaistella jeonii]VEI96618.1 Outer membrane cobalamin receptor protein [Kaistella jeonii]